MGAPDQARAMMPADFHDEAYRSILAVLPTRLGQLQTAYAEL